MKRNSDFRYGERYFKEILEICNGGMLRLSPSINWRTNPVPAPAVIPVPVAYPDAAAFKTLVSGLKRYTGSFVRSFDCRSSSRARATTTAGVRALSDGLASAEFFCGGNDSRNFKQTRRARKRATLFSASVSKSERSKQTRRIDTSVC